MKFALSRENLSLGFATRYGSNQPLQLLARTLKLAGNKFRYDTGERMIMIMITKAADPNCTDLLASLVVCAFIGLKQQIMVFWL